MNAIDIVKEVKQARGCSLAYLAEKLEKKRAVNIAEMLKGKDMWAGNFFKLLDAMEYEIVVQPKKGLQGEKYVVKYEEK